MSAAGRIAAIVGKEVRDTARDRRTLLVLLITAVNYGLFLRRDHTTTVS